MRSCCLGKCIYCLGNISQKLTQGKGFWTQLLSKALSFDLTLPASLSQNQDVSPNSESNHMATGGEVGWWLGKSFTSPTPKDATPEVKLASKLWTERDLVDTSGKFCLSNPSSLINSCKWAGTSDLKKRRSRHVGSRVNSHKPRHYQMEKHPAPKNRHFGATLVHCLLSPP